MNAGERIKILRKSMGYSAEYIAEQIGVSPSTIYRYENNDISSMKIDNLKKIADLLGTKAVYLLGWFDEDPVSVDLPSPALAASEQRLFDMFHSLNEEGQEKVLEYTTDLVASGRYIKNNESDVVEEA